MKRWAKILLVIGIVWLVLATVYLWYACAHMSNSVVCFSMKSCPPPQVGCDLEGWSIGLLVVGFPAWLMFLVVAIWGRNRK